MDVYLKVKNFGPIKEAEIDLRPLTVFVGESNTGKTYLAALIYALHRHFEGFSQLPYSTSAASFLGLVYGTRRHFSLSLQDKVEYEKSDVLEKLNTPHRPFKYSDLPQQMHTQFESKLSDPEDLANELKRCFDLKSISKLIRFTGSPNNEMNVSLSVWERDQTLWTFDLRDTGPEPIMDWYINSDVVLLSSDDKTFDLGDLLSFLLGKQEEGRNSYYLPAARSGVMQSRDVLATALIKRATRIGLDQLEMSTFSGMIGDFLEQIFGYKKYKGPSCSISHVAEQLETELLEGKIEIKRHMPEAFPEFLYRPNQAEEALRMSHSSAMVSELAPLVLYLRGIVKQGDMLIIEEPESHLHPGAQTIIAKTLARLVRAGVRVLITTHSNYLLQQISNLIREGELQKQGESTNETVDYLKAEEVGAWSFHKDKPVEELPFNLVEGIEPEDHLDIAEDLYNQSAGLQNRIEETKEGDTVESE